MMATLIDWYPGDRALGFVLIVAFGVALLSSAAWVVSWHLSRKPAIRHLVLVAAMVCCLAMPVLALVCTVSGLTLIAVPLLPAHSGAWDGESPDGRMALLGASPWERARSQGGRFTPPDPRLARGEKEGDSPLATLSFLKMW
jgi:hypothetical protein